MAYQSGRTVKSPKSKPTTIASATRDARRVIARIYPAAPWNVGITVDSSRTADHRTLAPQIRTVVTFPESLPSPSTLALALYELPGLVDCRSDAVSITIVRTA